MTAGRRPYVLLTNDDGIDAPGLHALADALAPDYDLLIVAPHVERSATGHAISVLKNLRLERYERGGAHWGWSFEGRPADCVKVAVTTISPDRPFDLVLAGINAGQNLGVNVLYSGTVAAAREGVIFGIPSIAFSVVYRDPDRVPYATGARVAVELTRRVVERGLPPGVLLNVNVPDLPYDALQGYAVTRQGRSYFRDKFERVQGDLEGRAIFRNVGDRFAASPDGQFDLDDQAIAQRRVSVTPLHVDATAHHHVRSVQDLFRPQGPQSPPGA